jgi:plasmid stabilization system protein ParE
MRIRWTDAAVHDLTAICDYIQEQSTSETARRVAFSMYSRLNGCALPAPESRSRERLRKLRAQTGWWCD